MNKKYLLYVVIPVLSLASIGSVYANSISGQENRPIESVINTIAEKFNLDVNDVQQVFEEHRATVRTEKQKMFEEKISQAVVDEKISQEQANMIIEKKSELQAERQNLQNGTPEENRELAKKHMEELKQWAEENNIPIQYLMFAGPKGSGRMNPMAGKQIQNCIAE
ncbi:MAG: hypothetical protein PHS18_07405 [Sphaerochaetaceae bacterium]|jgi:superfamily II DNA helicase RecQ|nr:hypothetical protein [Sphaerochaetaceae bacterium]